MALPKVEKGDVFALNLTNGFGLIQCVKEAPEKDLEKIRILPGVLHVINDEIVKSAVSGNELFFCDLPLKYAVRKNMIKRVGNHPIPKGSKCPGFFRTKHMVRSEFLGWHIVDGETWNRELVYKLSPEQRTLSPWGTISIPDIAERIENNWTPSEWI